MEDFEKTLKKILKESKSINDVEDRILKLKLHTLPNMEKLSEIMLTTIPSIKDSVFKSYQNYCIYYISLLGTIKNSKILVDKHFLVYPMIFNLHQAIELFYKAYKVFYHNLYGYDTEPTRALRTSTPLEIDIKGHEVEALFDDKEILFVFELFGIDNSLANKIKFNYLEIKNMVGFKCVSDQARYPQGIKNFLPDELIELKEQDIDKIFDKIYETIRIMTECFLKQYQMDLDKDIVKKVINRLK